MALTAEKTEFLNRVGAYTDELAELIVQGIDLVDVWNDRSYSTGIVAQDLTDAGVDYSTTDLSNMITAYSALKDYRDNTAVSAADRGGVINKVRKTS